MKKILIIGNPNVGKSVVFSRLTGVHVTASNYPGTTVEFTEGHMMFRGEKTTVIDVPGTYSLDPTNKAEEVAVDMLEHGDFIINVVDATNLERNLNLTLQLIERGKPTVVVLNMWDETTHRGISIDIEALRKELGVPVIPTVAVTGEGIRHMVEALESAKPLKKIAGTDAARWRQIGHIISNVQTLTHHHHTFRQRIEDIAVNPIGGVVLAAIILLASFWIIRFIGEGLITFAFDPFFEHLYSPILMKLSGLLAGNQFLHDIIIGKLIEGGIDYKQSFGVLTTGIYVPFAAVLPYIVAFYLVLGFLEDVGYLPRFAVLMDNLMHHLGLHGYAMIPHMLGLGCNVPGLLATRTLESKRERFIAITLISIGVPCAALQAMIIGVLGERGLIYVVAVYVILFITWLLTGMVLNRFVKGFSPELIMEMPPLRWPAPKAFFKKFWMRSKGFLKEALPIVLIGVLVVSTLYSLGLFEWVAKATAPVVEKIWGLPPDAVIAVVIGFLRKDVAVGMLTPLNLTTQQLIVGCSVLALTFPCIASFAVIFKELGLRLLLVSTAIMLAVAIVMGGLANLALGLIL
jgi:ferrous iron transport protein B